MAEYIYWAVTNDNILKLGSTSLTGKASGSFDVTEQFSGAYSTPWSDYTNDIRSIDIVSTITPVYMDYWFNFMYASFITNINNINTRLCRSMVSLFATFGTASSEMVNVDVSSWNTENLENLEGFLTSSKANLIGLNNFNTSKVTNLYRAFISIKDTNIISKIQNWDVSNVTNMYQTFRFFPGTEIRIPNWDTSKVTNMSGMFAGSDALTTLDLSSFNTENVTNMSEMFRDMPALEELDISMFSFASVTSANWMFNGDTNLKSILVDRNEVFPTSASAPRMFYNCLAIEGYSGTTYDSTRIDVSMANWQTGYFALPPAKYEFSYEAIGSGTVTSNVIAGLVKEGTLITLTATPDEYNEFDKWFSNSAYISEDNPYTFAIQEDTHIEGYFKELPRQKVDITSNIPYASAYISNTAPYIGDQITLFARPEPGYSFNKWSDGDRSNPRLITVSGDISLSMEYYPDIESYEIYQWRAFIKDQFDLSGWPKIFLKLKNFIIRNDLLTTANSVLYFYDISLEDRMSINEGDIIAVYDPYGEIFYEGVITQINMPSKSLNENDDNSEKDYSIEVAQMQHFYAGTTLYSVDPKSYLEDEIKSIYSTYASGAIPGSSYVDPIIANRMGSVTINAEQNLTTNLPTIEDNEAVDMEEFIYQLYEDYGIIFDFNINYQGANTVTIKVPQYSEAIKISNNTYAIKNLTPVTTIEETNRLVIFDEDGIYKETWVATENGNVKEPDAQHMQGRFPITKTEIVYSNDPIEDLVAAYLPNNMYNHKITFDLRIKNSTYDYKMFELGMPLDIYVNDEKFSTVLTGWEIEKNENSNLTDIHMICGKVRTSLTNKITRGTI